MPSMGQAPGLKILKMGCVGCSGPQTGPKPRKISDFGPISPPKMGKGTELINVYYNGQKPRKKFAFGSTDPQKRGQMSQNKKCVFQWEKSNLKLTKGPK
jgi:hypothetical protein